MNDNRSFEYNFGIPWDGQRGLFFYRLFGSFGDNSINLFFLLCWHLGVSFQCHGRRMDSVMVSGGIKKGLGSNKLPSIRHLGSGMLDEARL